MAKYDLKAREEEIKHHVAEDFFSSFDTTRIIGNIDFCVSERGNTLSLFTDENTISYLWAEAKKGNNSDIIESFVQLILTIGKDSSPKDFMPPAFLGAFDAEKIAFVQYNKIMHVFTQTDFNWNVRPSNHDTKEFRQLQSLLKKILEEENFTFDFEKDEMELKEFIKRNLATGTTEKIQVTKNNFVTVYYKWLEKVMPSIGADWEEEKKDGVIPSDFYLADLISFENITESIAANLSVRLDTNKYLFNVEHKNGGKINMDTVQFNDRQKAHREFWKNYERPPKEEYKSYILDRRDLLIPQDIRERKGSFFTPQKWVDLSMEYIEKVLGENWQDEYYIWDCCCGTGNLLAKITNPTQVFASTLDKADIDIIRENIQEGKSNLFLEHVFQFDFLNDDLQNEKVPERLRKILADENARKKLVIYINPPYAEAASTKTISAKGENKNKDGVAIENTVYKKYKDFIGNASNELFALFFIRIYREIKGCILGEFSKTKHLQSPNFEEFRNVFLSKLEKCFLVPGNTFDNVKGNFPIGFFIWNTGIEEKFVEIDVDTFLLSEKQLSSKKIFSYSGLKFINSWYSEFYDKNTKEIIGIMNTRGNDFQNFNYIRITSDDNHNHTNVITVNNLIPTCIYLSVRQCIEATWLNDRDQFLYPKDTWQTDSDFQSDCLAYTLFHGQNRISAKTSQNNWIPFTEKEVGNSISPFESPFMRDFITGKLEKRNGNSEEFKDIIMGHDSVYDGTKQIQFSSEATSVINAAREIWKYYFEKPHIKSRETTNASFYDIRLFFQGDTNGRMNSTSTDERYNELIADLRAKQKILAKKIALKVYEHGFLR